MIPRYSLPEMSNVWSDDNTYDLWLKVEIAASQAWTELGVVPAEDMEKLRSATFNRETYDRIFEETKHDLVSFTRAVSESLGPESRWIHHGLTSNDVKDTGLGMQMAQSVDIIDAGVERLMKVLKRRALEFRDTPCIGRSHGIHAEPMSFGLKLAMWWDEMRRNRDRLDEMRKRVAICMLSGPVGTFAGVPPEIEESVARQLHLSPAPISNQVIQRDRHAEFVQTLALIAATLDKIATEIRALQRNSGIRHQGIFVHAAQAESRAFGADQWSYESGASELPGCTRKRCSLARAGSCGRLHTSPDDWNHRRNVGVPGPDDAEP
jgi:adenylosuccinate lyase